MRSALGRWRRAGARRRTAGRGSGRVTRRERDLLEHLADAPVGRPCRGDAEAARAGCATVSPTVCAGSASRTGSGRCTGSAPRSRGSGAARAAAERRAAEADLARPAAMQPRDRPRRRGLAASPTRRRAPTHSRALDRERDLVQHLERAVGAVDVARPRARASASRARGGRVAGRCQAARAPPARADATSLVLGAHRRQRRNAPRGTRG